MLGCENNWVTLDDAVTGSNLLAARSDERTQFNLTPENLLI